ncbi:MAG: hypothetical protein B655_2100 [Methanobacterium sp. Maddingley MBC34]|nr:MAG: hypothetical protein B655_2100 [Methanobacterium sp. Maddingley MBC34]
MKIKVTDGMSDKKEVELKFNEISGTELLKC